MKYIKSEKYSLKTVGTKHMLFPTFDLADKFQGAILLNDVAVFVWNELSQSNTMNVLLTKILDSFDVDKDTAESDLKNLLDEFIKLEIIKEIES